MAQQGVLWQLVSGFDPLGQRGLAGGIQQRQQQENILQQLMGQQEDRTLRREDSLRQQQNTDRQFGFNQTQAERQAQQWQQQFQAGRGDAAFNQAHQNRVFGLQERTANEAQLTTYELPDGTKIPLRVDRQGNAQIIAPPNLPQSNPTNPYAPTGKTTDEQAKAAGYANRMAQSNDIIGKFENINSGVLGNIEGMVANAAPALANPALSAQRQQFVQAQRDFINAILRRESGAVISDSEFANARQQYFPQPGDSADVLKQKAANRLTAIQGIMGAAGRQYQPPANYRPQPQNNANQQTMVNPPQANQPKVQISTQQEFDRLPSGSLFIMNGKSYQKP